MRIAIGDIHGRSYWEHYLTEPYTEYYILGDYFDSYTIPFETQLANFKRVMNAVERDSRIKCCLGNHDYHYVLNDERERYSGYQARHANEIRKILAQYSDILKIIYITADNILISHAGLSAAFMKEKGFSHAGELNDAFLKNPALFRFNGVEPYGNEVQQGPLWIRPGALARNPYGHYSQIAGHTCMREITHIALQESGEDGAARAITFIDTHDAESIYRF